MVAHAKHLTPRRTLTVLGCPLPGLVRAAGAGGPAPAGNTMPPRADSRVAVAKDDGDAYVCDLAAGTCGCAAGRFRRVERCRHLCACDVLSARGHL